MHIRFQPRAQDTLRVAISGPPVERKVLRADLQHLPVFLQPHARAQFHRIPQIIGFDIAPPAELIQTAAIDARHRTADAKHG